MATNRNSAYFRQTFTGFEELEAALKGIPLDMKGEIVGAAVGKAGKLVADYAKGLAARKTGALAASITSIVRRYRGGETAVSVVGPDSRYRGKDNSRPAKYAHLVEFGHRIAKGKLTRVDGRGPKRTGTVAGYVPARPFMRPAALAYTPVLPEILAHGVREGLDKSIRKRVRAGTHVR